MKGKPAKVSLKMVQSLKSVYKNNNVPTTN